MDLNNIVLLVAAILVGIMACAKPVIIYNNMKNRTSKGVSCFHFFVMGAVYIALSGGLFSFLHGKKPFAHIFFAIFFLLGLWNIYYGYLVARLKKENSKTDAEKSEANPKS